LMKIQVLILVTGAFYKEKTGVSCEKITNEQNMNIEISLCHLSLICLSNQTMRLLFS